MSIFAALESPPTLHWINIRFGTPTYDEVEQDMKITWEGQLGLIGGNMGLFTGFSILSGVELLYFIVKLILNRVRHFSPKLHRICHV